jgi:uncharacterized protein YggU (UPF0235/DUF167 family)
VRVAIRVRPGAKATTIGGSHDGALVVRVRERAVDGRATEAALKALAGALGIRSAEVRLVAGATSRTKLVEVPDDVADTYRRLLASPTRP